MTEQRMIDANALMKNVGKNPQLRGITYSRMKKAVEETPTIDAVPVVRCKDCKYYRQQRPDAWSDNPMRCDHPELTYDVECFDHWLDVGPEDFCSRGEKRDAKEEV